MGRESYALLTGLFIVTLGAALVAIAMFLGDYGTERDVYLVVTQGSVSGLNPESTVIYRGVQAGKVTSIRFDPKDVRNILVRIEINPGLPITQGTYATLRVQGLTGLAQVELNDTGENPVPLVTSAKSPAQIPLRPSLVDKLTASGQDLLPQLTELAARINTLVDDENRTRIQHILANVETATQQLVTVQTQLTKALASFPNLKEELNRTLKEMAAMSRDVKETSRQVRSLGKTAENWVSSGQAAGESLRTTTLPQLHALVEEARVMFKNLKQLSSLLKDDPQTLLLGTPQPAPGPGEPGYRDPQ